MKKIILLSMIFMVLGTINGQVFNTSPTGTQTPCFIDEAVITSVYVNGTHYVGINRIGQNALLEGYDDDCNLLMSVIIPEFGPGSFTSGFLPVDIISDNNSLYIVVGLNLDEEALVRYNLNTSTLEISTRLSLRNEAIQDISVNNGRPIMGFGAVSNNFTVAIAANWANPVPMAYDVATSNGQAFAVDAEADLANPSLLSHLKDANFDHYWSENAILNLQDGDMYFRFSRDSQQGSGDDRDIFFVKIDATTGNVLDQRFFDGPRTIEQAANGDLLMTSPSYNYTPPGGSLINVERNTFGILESNDWSEKMNSGQITANGNDLYNIHITDDSFVLEAGLPNYNFISFDNRQSWMFLFLRKNNLQRKYIASGELLERYFDIINQPLHYMKFDFTDYGYRSTGYYGDGGTNNGIPSWWNGSTYESIDYGGVELTAASSGGAKTFKGLRIITIPTETFMPQLGIDGVAVYPGKKLVNGVLTNSDEFDSILSIDDAIDLNAWIGNQIDPSYITGGNASGWSVWADYPEYGLGNVQINTTSDIFVDVAMYDWPDFLPFFGAKSITRTKFQRVYLINEEDLGNDDIPFEDVVLYPNPTEGVLYISSSVQINFVQITNMLGQIVKTLKTNYGIQEIGLSDLPIGMYLVTLSDGYSVDTKRIIKK